MTIIDFYKKLSKLLTDARENFISHNQAKQRLQQLIETSQDYGLDVNINSEILGPIFLMRLDDEESFTERDDEDEDYETDYGFSFI